jgi:hypothetical protein
MALYVEGVRCPFTEVQLVTEDGMIPRIVFTIPPSPTMRDLPRRARLHFIVRELVKDEWIVMFEGEVMSRGFRKTPQSRDLTFMGYHVAGHLDQYAISALDPTAKTQATMQAAPEFRTASLASVNGTMLALFNPTVIAALVGTDPDKLTYPDFIQGARQRYEQVVEKSRIAEAYPHEAVKFHRIFDRMKGALPDKDLFDWDEFYSKLMIQVFNFGTQTVGGRVTFFEFLRHMSQFFLHQVSVLPNAEHWTKQIQVRPNTFFHPIPRCNIIYSSLSEEYAYEENYETKPTRLEAHFLPLGTAPGQNMSAVARFTTVYAPNELQESWKRITDALDEGGTTVDATMDEDKDGKPIVNAPKDGIKFLTREEEQRGIIGAYYDIPQTLQHAIMSLVEHPAGAQESSPMRQVDPAKASEHGQKVLKGTAEVDRIEKYRAFLCMALGDGGGIKPGRFGAKQPFEDYRRPGQLLHILTGSNDSRFGKVPKIVPRRLTVVPLNLTPHYVDNTQKAGFKHPDNKSPFIASGVNYFVDANGNLLQVLPRRAHLFAQPSAVPFGMVVSGVAEDELAEINTGMLSLNQKRTEATDTPFFVGTVTRTPFTENDLGNKVQYWPPELTAAGIPNPDAGFGQPLGEFYFDERVGVGDPTLKGTAVFGAADFAKIEKNRSEFTISSYTGAFNYIGQRDQKATIVDARAIAVAGNKAVYWIKLNRAIVAPLAKHRVLIQNKSHEGKQVAPNKPWVLIPPSKRGEAKAGPKVPVSVTSLKSITAKSSISNPDQTSGGNHFNFAVGVETRDGRITPKAEATLAWLSAVVMELTAEHVGTLKAPVPNQAQRQPKLGAGALFEIADYYHAASGYRRLAAGTMDRVRAKAQQLASQLYKDFNVFDKELTDGQLQSLTDITLTENTGPGTFTQIPGDISNQTDTGAGADAAASSAAGASSAFTEGVQVTLDKKMLDNFVDHYIAAIVNYEYYNLRYAAQGFSAQTVFNPYAVVGYPCLLLDNSDAKYHLVGFLHSTAHIFHGDGQAYTSMTYSHVRNARWEKLLPYSKGVDQYFLFRDVKPWRDGEAYRNEYHARLKALNPPAFIGADDPRSFIPWELMDYRSKATPPFMYSGGFGFDKDMKRDFKALAAYVGYVDGASVATDLEAANQFVYADDPLVNFADDAAGEGEGLSGTAATNEDIDAIRALELIYRKVQKIDQLDPEKSQASLVAFVHGETRHYDDPPINIDVYQATPEIGKDGFPVRKIKDDGTVDGAIAWQTDIQNRVYAHLDLVRQRTAIRG